MTNMQAAVGLAQLEKLDEILKIRDKQLSIYQELLSELPNVMVRPSFNWGRSVHWLMTLLLEKENIRDSLIERMAISSVETRKMIYPVYHSKPYTSLGNKTNFNNAEKISLNSIHLPSFTGLKNSDIRLIVKIFKEQLNYLL